MFKIKKILFSLIIFPFICISSPCFGDETQLFSSLVSPDALIIQDLSGSMQCPPSGYQFYASDSDPYACYENGPFYSSSGPGYTQLCDFSWWGYAPYYSNSTCTDPYYFYPQGNDSTDCSKLAMSKNAIFQILDANHDGIVEGNPWSPAGAIGPDQTALGVRIGYMNFYGSYCPYVCGVTCPDTCGTTLVNSINTDYSVIWNSVNATQAYGGTPLAESLSFAKTTLDNSKASDPAAACRQKFAILITDGDDTYACGGDGTENQPIAYMGRKATVANAYALAAAGYKLFTVAWGGTSMPPAQMNTLNWAAYYGGTSNPLLPQSGSTSAITISNSACTDPSTNDPANANLSGYSFLVTNAAQLETALQSAFNIVQRAALSFDMTSVASVRVSDTNYLYQASFVPSSSDPFWTGHLEKYGINSDGSIGSMVWDAGFVLQQQVQSSSSRNVLTYLGGSMTQFAGPPNGPGWGTWQGYLGTDTNTAKSIIGYIQGSSNPDNWELGDIFHSNPIVIGSPSAYFIDPLSPNAFSTFRTNEQNRQRIVLAGANDGQLHAFETTAGHEQWSFIPPNLLPKLQYLAHSSNSGTLPAHMYFVDGPVAAGDVWLGSGNGANKSANDWRTLLVFSEGRGVRDSTNTTASYLWSSSQSCDGGFNYKYDSGHPYYCGYWAFDVTNTSANPPTLINNSALPHQWLIPLIKPSASQASYLAEPWSKMAIGKVIVGGNEKWVGFIGGGYDNSGDSNRGKGFFVVDLTSGNIIWSFTRGGSNTYTTSTSMTYSLPGSAAIVDTDNDGFIDTAYIGDLGGNVWRFTFCTGANGSGCNTSNWSGGPLFSSAGLSTIPLIYTTPSAGRGSSGDIWVFWGTGDKENPAATGTQDWFFGVKDNDRSSTYTAAQLQNITNSVFSYTSPGWYITLGSGEKVLADPSAFGGMVTWTTYVPYTGTNPCNQAGTSNLYSVAMMPVAIGGVTYQVGAGLFATTTGNVVGTRSMSLGSGVAQVPIYSQKPGGTGSTDAYVSMSGGGQANTSILSSAAMGSTPYTQRLQATSPSAQLLHWWDQRVQ